MSFRTPCNCVSISILRPFSSFEILFTSDFNFITCPLVFFNFNFHLSNSFLIIIHSFMQVNQVWKDFSHLIITAFTKPMTRYYFLHNPISLVLDIHTFCVIPLITNLTTQPVISWYFVTCRTFVLCLYITYTPRFTLTFRYYEKDSVSSVSKQKYVNKRAYFTLQGLTSSSDGPTRRYRTLTRAGLLDWHLHRETMADSLIYINL